MTRSGNGDSPIALKRRGALAAIAAGALVVGFDPSSKRWIREAEASGGCGGFPGWGLPQLDGTLHLDLPTRTGDSNDNGLIVQKVPAAVLRPGSTNDVKKMVRFCRQYGIKVSARGQHHTVFGQGLTTGLIIETQTLNTIHSIGPDGAEVDGGVLWKDLLIESLQQGLRPRGLTGYTGLSIGGTLSVGGCPLSNDQGGLADHVQSLTIVTGKGNIVECSDCDHADLFEAALGGLGQCGIITRAKVDLVPALPMARTYLLHHVDNALFFEDLRTLLDRGELDEIYNVCVPPGLAPFVYQINATVFFDPAEPPDDDYLLRELNLPPEAVVVVDQPYLDYALFVDYQIEALRQSVDWDHLVKPWFDVWMPDSTVEPFVGETLANLTPVDVGAGGFVLILCQRRSAMKRPFYRLPDPECGSDWIFLYDILTSSMVPGPDPAFAAQMLDRNRDLFEAARDLGGVRYPIGAMDFSHWDWVAHYGNRWHSFRQRKQKYDPDKILTPGLNIF
ncbi:MAG: FAD-binding protein [Polyangiaceae bacterium]|nr:FAD-binding protein [Polyangiaceae bacterium]